MDTWWQAPAKDAMLKVTLPGNRIINRFMIKEAIAHRGERVEAHFLEARINGQWQRIADGRTIGHKRILRFPAVETDAFRLHITKSRLAPAIAHISAHYYDEPPKPVRFQRDENNMLSMGVGIAFSWNDHGVSDLTQNIHYTTDGSEPRQSSVLYTEPLSLPLGGHIRARAIVEGRKGPITDVWIGIDRKNWTATDSYGRTEEPSRVLNGNPQSRWITHQSDEGPFGITIDMKEVFTISGFKYLPNTQGGFIERYQVEISTDGQTWQAIHEGTFGNIINDPSERTVLFDNSFSARYVRLSGLIPPGALQQVGAAEIEILQSL